MKASTPCPARITSSCASAGCSRVRARSTFTASTRTCGAAVSSRGPSPACTSRSSRRSRRRSGTSPARPSACPSTSSSEASSATRSGVYCDTALYQRQLPTPQDFATRRQGSGGRWDSLRSSSTSTRRTTRRSTTPTTGRRAPASCGAWSTRSRRRARRWVRTIDICVDMHGRYDMTTGEQIAKRLEPLNLMWLEEPIPAENVEAYRRITESTSTPICAGENHYLAPRLPAAARGGRRRHRDAGPAEGRRARRGPAHRQPREPLLRALRPAHGRLVPRRHGCRSRLRVGPELPGARVADLLPPRAAVQGDRHASTARWS